MIVTEVGWCTGVLVYWYTGILVYRMNALEEREAAASYIAICCLLSASVDVMAIAM